VCLCAVQEEVREKIGEGIASLGPTMTLDTLVEILLISIGTITGQLLLLSFYSCPVCLWLVMNDQSKVVVVMTELLGATQQILKIIIKIKTSGRSMRLQVFHVLFFCCPQVCPSLRRCVVLVASPLPPVTWSS